MQYHTLRNVQIRNASIALFTETDFGDRPKRLPLFRTEGGGDGDKVEVDVDLYYEAVGVDASASCASHFGREVHDNAAAQRVLAPDHCVRCHDCITAI